MRDAVAFVAIEKQDVIRVRNQLLAASLELEGAPPREHDLMRERSLFRAALLFVWPTKHVVHRNAGGRVQRTDAQRLERIMGQIVSGRHRRHFSAFPATGSETGGPRRKPFKARTGMLEGRPFLAW